MTHSNSTKSNRPATDFSSPDAQIAAAIETGLPRVSVAPLYRRHPWGAAVVLVLALCVLLRPDRGGTEAARAVHDRDFSLRDLRCGNGVELDAADAAGKTVVLRLAGLAALNGGAAGKAAEDLLATSRGAPVHVYLAGAASHDAAGRPLVYAYLPDTATSLNETLLRSGAAALDATAAHPLANRFALAARAGQPAASAAGP